MFVVMWYDELVLYWWSSDECPNNENRVVRHQDLLLASDVTYMMYVLYGILLLSVAVSSMHVI